MTKQEVIKKLHEISADNCANANEDLGADQTPMEMPKGNTIIEWLQWTQESSWDIESAMTTLISTAFPDEPEDILFGVICQGWDT